MNVLHMPATIQATLREKESCAILGRSNGPVLADPAEAAEATLLLPDSLKSFLSYAICAYES
jgi:hypothetical protein